MSEWEKFYKKVRTCHEKLIKDHLTAKEKEASSEEAIQSMKLKQRCYYQQLAYVSDRRFAKLIDELVHSVDELAEIVSERRFKYQSKFIDARQLLEFQTFTEKLNFGLLKEIDDAIASEDIRLIGRMFVLSFYNNIAYDFAFNSFNPLFDLIAVCQEQLGLNMDWILALISVAMQEALVKKKVREFGYNPNKKSSFHNISKELMTQLEKLGERIDMDVLLTEGFRNVRHLVIHDPQNWNPTEDEANEVVRHTLNLASYLNKVKKS